MTKTQMLEYSDAGKMLRGHLAWDDSRGGKRPGVLVFHENRGLTEHEKERAERLAKMGYVALACDMFGEPEQPAPATDEARKAAFEEFRRAKLLRRAMAGYEVLAARPEVDKARMAAIGFCMGGLAALEMARSGAALKGVVSFHGALTPVHPAVAGKFKAKVLACHGAADPFITLEQVTAFAQEMEVAAVDYQVILYGGAVHGFTNPAADKVGRPGVGYDARADARSWEAMRGFFAEIFGVLR